MSQKLVFCLVLLVACLCAVNAQYYGGYYGGYGGYGGYDPLVGGPNRQWRRYYRCVYSGYCPYDYNTGHYYGRRELNRMYYGGYGGYDRK